MSNTDETNKLLHLPVPIIGAKPTINVDDWIVVFSYGQKFIAKPATSETPSATLLKCLREGTPLICTDALDYTTPFRPVQTPQGIGITRDNIAAPVDTSCQEMPLYVIPTGGYALANLQPIDKETYKTIIEDTLGSRKNARTQKSPVGGGGDRQRS